MSTRENPADLPTRGVAVAELALSEMWWRGPTFLSEEEEAWPKTKMGPSPDAATEVRKKVKTTFGEPVRESTLFVLKPEVPSRLQPSRFSSWNSLVRVRAWVQQFVNNCRAPAPVEHNGRSSGELKCQEVVDVETEIIKEAQQRSVL